MENRKIIVSFYVLCSLVVGFLSRNSIQYFYTLTYKVRKLPGIQFFREFLPVLLGAIVFIVFIKHKKVNEVMDEVIAELKKVTWPSRPEVVRSTLVVIVCIVIASFILGMFDGLWGKLMSQLLYGS